MYPARHKCSILDQLPLVSQAIPTMRHAIDALNVVNPDPPAAPRNATDPIDLTLPTWFDSPDATLTGYVSDTDAASDASGPSQSDDAAFSFSFSENCDTELD
jgi:hypothetical protein